MCEIFILVSMCRYLHRTAKNKGQPGWPFVLLMIFAWFVGGIGGAIAGTVAMGDGGNEDISIPAIIGYVIGVSLACIGNALIVAMLPDRTRDTDRDRYEDERDYTERRRPSGAPRGRLADEHEEDDRRDRDDREDDRRDRDEREDDRNWRPRKWE